MNFPYTKLIFFLKEFLKQTFGEHWPIEIITYITLISYKPIKIYCGNHCMNMLSENDLHFFGETALDGGMVLDKLSPRDIKSIKHDDTRILILTTKCEVYNHKLNPPLLMRNVKKIICRYNYTLIL